MVGHIMGSNYGPTSVYARYELGLILPNNRVIRVSTDDLGQLARSIKSYFPDFVLNLPVTLQGGSARDKLQQAPAGTEIDILHHAGYDDDNEVVGIIRIRGV